MLSRAMPELPGRAARIRGVEPIRGARTWQSFNRGLGTPDPAALAVDRTGRTIFAGTQGGGVVALTLNR